jgi:predicted enzyme related to lactoylglutathione lyase
MGVTATFAGIAVRDFRSMVDWYERLLGREPDMYPHDTEAAWQLTEGGWLYVVEDPERAGDALLTLLVDDLDDEVARVAASGLEMEPIYTIPGKARKAETDDPEGNRISLGQPISN